MSTLGQGPSLRKKPLLSHGKEKPLLGHGRILLSLDIAEDKRGNLSLVLTLHIVPQSRKNTKAEKDNRENESV